MFRVSSSRTTGILRDMDPECLPSYFVRVLFKRFVTLLPHLSSSKSHIALSDITGLPTSETVLLLTALLDKATSENMSDATDALRLLLVISLGASPLHKFELLVGMIETGKILPSIPAGRNYISQAVEYDTANNPLSGQGSSKEVQNAVTALIRSWKCVFTSQGTPTSLIEQAVREGIIPTLEGFTMSDLILDEISDHCAIQLSRAIVESLADSSFR